MADRLAVPEYGGLREQLLHHYHEELGHYGQLIYMKEYYYWPGMIAHAQSSLLPVVRAYGVYYG